MTFSAEVLRARQARVANALPLDDAILLIGAGDPIPLPEGTDQTYPFRAHADYFFLTGLECRGGVVAFDPRDGAEAGWVSFVPDVTESERIWEGRQQAAGTPLALFKAWLNERIGRPRVVLGVHVRGVDADAAPKMPPSSPCSVARPRPRRPASPRSNRSCALA
jgi:hypothetical protein